VHITVCTCRRQPLFRERVTADRTRALLVASFPDPLRLDAFCFMPDHLHALIMVDEGGAVLRAFARFKQASAQAYRLAGGSRLWQRGFHDRILRRDEDLLRTIAYILDNPVRRGLCEDWQDWTYSWSRWAVEE
jgi:REP element-mobilizing transposase RayT